MKLVFNLNEGLNPREKQIYIDAINDDCEDIEDLKEVVHEIYWYDKRLFAQINKFPKDASFEDIKANILKHLGENMEESMSLQRDRFDSVEDYLEKNTESFSVNNGTITLDEPGEVNKALKILKKYYDDVDYSVESDALGDPYWNISFADLKDDDLNEAYAKASADLAKDYVDYLEKYAVKIPGEQLADYDRIISDIDHGYIDALELGIEDIINSPQYNMVPGVDVQEAIREGKDLINRLYSAYSANFVGYGGYHGYGESLKESATGYYKLCVYIPDSGENGMMGDYSDTYAVVKAFDAKDAMEKFEKLLRSEGDEADLNRLNYFKNFHDFLVDSNMYIDDATEDEYKQFHPELEESASDISPEQRVADWKRAVQICKAYDPFTSYIDNYSQQKSAEAVNNDLTDEFVAIMKNHGVECSSIPLRCVNKSSLSEVSKALKAWVENKAPEQPLDEWYVAEDTIKTKDGKWTNKGDEGTHGKFNTKKEADAQRKAMFASGYHEDYERPGYEGMYLVCWDDVLGDYHEAKVKASYPQDAIDKVSKRKNVYKIIDCKKIDMFVSPARIRKAEVVESLNESSSSLEQEIYDLLNDMGGYTDYQGRIDAVAEQFGISKDEAEGYVCNWIQFYDEESAMDESLKESAAMDTAQKLEDDGWTVLSNGIRGGDMKHYWLARRMNKEHGKADWKAIDDETGEVMDITYDQALGKEPIGVSSGISKLSKQLSKRLLPSNESLKEDFSDFDLINYNDFLANNFDGWSNDIDYLMKDISKCARALKSVSNKLMFYVDYDEDFYAIDDIATVVRYISDDYSLYQMNDLSGINFVFGSENLWIFRNEEEANHVVKAIKDHVKSLNENFKLEGLVDITDDFREARNNWSKIIPDVDFDIALERWNKESKLADPDWYAKPIYSVAAWEDMVQMFKPNDIEDVPEPEDLELSEPEEDAEAAIEPSDDDFQLEDDENSAP